MNITVILGMLLGIGMLVFGIVDSGNGLKAVFDFIDAPSIAIVIGGTIAVLLTTYPLSMLGKIPKHLGKVLMPPKIEPRKAIEHIVEYCTVARSKGLLALEQSANECKDLFMKSSLLLLMDGIDSEKIRGILEDAIDNMEERHNAVASMYERGAQVAPGVGMMGTVIGLVNMLGGLTGVSAEESASIIGSGMAVALITTFYGSILANMLFNPIATRLRLLHAQELLYMEITKEGVLAIQAGTNPRNVQEKLELMLSKPNGKKKD